MDQLIQLQEGQRWLDPNGNAELTRTSFFHLDVSFFEVGIKLTLTDWGSQIDFTVLVPKTYAERTQGFLGNLDEREDNEFHTRENTIALPNLIGNAGQVTEQLIFPHLETLCKL